MLQAHPETLLWPVGFVAFWCGIMWFVSRLSGWAMLAEKYPGGGEDELIKWEPWQSGTFRASCGYNGCLWVGASQKGLQLRTGPWLLFRAGHAPVRIPWEAIESLTERKMLWMVYDQLKVRNIPFTIDLQNVPGVDQWRPELRNAPAP